MREHLGQSVENNAWIQAPSEEVSALVSESERYYDSVAMGYDRLYMDAISQAENEFIQKQILSSLPPAGSLSVVDLGCGTGLGLRLLRDDKRVSKYTGIDVSTNMLNIAQILSLPDGETQFFNQDMSNLSFAHTDDYDMAISLFGAYSHLTNIREAIQELHRILRPGSSFFVMFYSRFSLRNLFLLPLEKQKSISPSKYYSIRRQDCSTGALAHFYSPTDLRELFSAFKTVEIQGLNALFELPILTPIFNKYLGMTKLRRAMEIESKILQSVPFLCHSLIVKGTK